MQYKLTAYIRLARLHTVSGLLTIISWFRRKRPELLEDPEWVMKATERERTLARFTGKYPSHPPGRQPVYRPTDPQIRELARKIIEEAKKAKQQRE